MNSNQKGRVTEAKVLARLIQLGKRVLLPFGNSGRYDLVVDNEDGTFTRIECKSGRVEAGCIIFHTQSRGGYGKGPQKRYSDDADVFGVWCAKTDKVYLVPVKGAPKSAMSLRIDAPMERSNRTKCKYAVDFEV